MKKYIQKNALPFYFIVALALMIIPAIIVAFWGHVTWSVLVWQVTALIAINLWLRAAGKAYIYKYQADMWEGLVKDYQSLMDNTLTKLKATLEDKNAK